MMKVYTISDSVLINELNKAAISLNCPFINALGVYRQAFIIAYDKLKQYIEELLKEPNTYVLLFTALNEKSVKNGNQRRKQTSDFYKEYIDKAFKVLVEDFKDKPFAARKQFMDFMFSNVCFIPKKCGYISPCLAEALEKHFNNDRVTVVCGEDFKHIPTYIIAASHMIYGGQNFESIIVDTNKYLLGYQSKRHKHTRFTLVIYGEGPTHPPSTEQMVTEDALTVPIVRQREVISMAIDKVLVKLADLVTEYRDDNLKIVHSKFPSLPNFNEGFIAIVTTLSWPRNKSARTTLNTYEFDKPNIRFVDAKNYDAVKRSLEGYVNSLRTIYSQKH